MQHHSNNETMAAITTPHVAFGALNLNLPLTMRAAQGTSYGRPRDPELLSVEKNVKVPQLIDIDVKERKKFAVVKTLSVALAPGDVRVLSGKTSPLQGPPAFPYVPGGDLCGVIVQLDSPSEPFQVGDKVVSMFHEAPRGALSEYSLINTDVCSKVPDNVKPGDAACLGSSGPAAMAIADRIQKGDRVLIYGAGGGVGSLVCQLARLNGASYVVGVSQDPKRLLNEPLSVDRAIDYTKEDVHSVKEFQENKFDLIIDLASGGWIELLKHAKTRDEPIVKSTAEGGRYVTLTPDNPTFEAHTWWEILKIFLFPALRRAFYTRASPLSRRRLPKYTYAIGLPSDRKDLDRVVELVSSGKLKVCIDPRGPFELTTPDVVKAFEIQESRHVKGKVVIKVADLD